MDASTLLLPALIAASFLAMITGGVGFLFQLRKERLPEATRYEDLKQRRQQEEAALALRQEQLDALNQKIQDKDRLAAEVAYLTQRIQDLEAESASLDTARADIEETKQRAAEVASLLAEKQQQLSEREAQVKEFEARLSAAADAVEAVQRSAADAEKRLADAVAAIEEASRERTQIMAELAPLRVERDTALRAIEEARSVQLRSAQIEADLETLRDQLQSLEPFRQELESIKFELGQSRSDLASVRDEVDGLRARKAQLEQDIAGFTGRTLTGGAATIANDDVLSDLKVIPAVLTIPNHLRNSKFPEGHALHETKIYLRNLGLRYANRTLNAFHTALKINDQAQLTVLAGVSGTGKSLLPRRYAEAMGIHFLQVAVEPRWDSPQDLLGFYNYVEKRYRATDLARLLVQLDPYNTSEISEDTYREHMALVLLDEMNLARVEYYFSEFLSRLESRPQARDANDESKRLDANMPLDIRGLDKSLSLFPSHNILFAGTMNDDESTQALSDKVLDRGNVMQFAAPKTFETSPPVQDIDRQSEALPFVTWRSWVKEPHQLEDNRRAIIDGYIGRLATIMEQCGRPFGHRLRDAILAYVANYPQEDARFANDKISVADQIELRIMPKLRGVELDGKEAAFDDLEALLRELDDAEFADRLAQLREQQAGGSGLFVWRGLTRS